MDTKNTGCKMPTTPEDEKHIYIKSAFPDENGNAYQVPIDKAVLKKRVEAGASLKELADFWGVHYSTFADNSAIRKIVNPAKVKLRTSLKERAIDMALLEGSEAMMKFLLDRIGKWDDEREVETVDEDSAPKPLIFAQPVYDINSIPEDIKEQIRKESKP